MIYMSILDSSIIRSYATLYSDRGQKPSYRKYGLGLLFLAHSTLTVSQIPINTGHFFISYAGHVFCMFALFTVPWESHHSPMGPDWVP